MSALTAEQERACTAASMAQSTWSYECQKLKSRLLMLQGMPFETRTEAEVRRDIKRLTETLNYLANRRKEASNEQAA